MRRVRGVSDSLGMLRGWRRIVKRSSPAIVGSASALPGRKRSWLTHHRKRWPRQSSLILTTMAGSSTEYPWTGRSESMRIDGRWYACTDDVIRPVVEGEILAADGTAIVTMFLIDTGADRTIISKDILDQLGHRLLSPSYHVEGLGVGSHQS